MDLESTLDELYALRPQEFTAARNERAARARRAGDRELAERIRALRKPTVSAWAGNLLVRREPERIQALIRLGEGLRDAHRNLDGEQLREFGRQQHLLVGALAREARRLAAEAGQPVGESALHEIEATLHAVLADPDAARQWAAGHLDKPLSAPVGFTGLEASATATPKPAERAKPAKESKGAKEAKPAKKAEEAEEATEAEAPPPAPSAEQRRAERAERRRREKLDHARQDAEAAERQARESEQAREEATAELKRAQAAFEEGRERVDALSRELADAKARHRRSESGLREARDLARETERTAREARRRAEKAVAAVDRLSDGGG
ncbi:hypothetical protein [Streptomyces peucetius]|uniref:Transposase n=1 Tax=Streptomyces peucetius TaxID=1950 RepID=A0ABY6I0M1_STRPE|nr:hypothetical protein [Streptomyces peucetius]UYQ60509.1 hypothetical protein OGH68_02800 [Streptomyces peucetius]